MNNKLPNGWKHTAIVDIADVNPKFDRKLFSDSIDVSFIPMKRVSEISGKVDLSEVRKFGKLKIGYTPFQNNDILFAKITPCMENGKIAILSGLKNGIGFGSTEFHVIRLPELILKKYLFYYLVQDKFRKEALGNMTGSVGQKRVPTEYIKDSSIPLAPLAEQNRIVSKIDELFTKLEAGVDSLKKVQILLKKYRQSVLKSAVEGKLTSEWRKQHKDELEPGVKLLERILKERKEKWEAEQLAYFKAKGIKPPKEWKDKYKEPSPPDTSNLPELPEGWIWASGDQLTTKVVDGTHFTPTYIESGIPFISVKDVRDDKIYFDKCKYISKDEHNKLIQRCYPQNGDVVITKSGTIGRTAVVDTKIEFSLFVSVALLKKSTKLLDSYFLKLITDGYIQSINVQQIVKGGVIKNLHLEDIRIVPLRLAPLQEQKQIINEVDRHFSIISKLDAQINNELKRSQSLRQSILKKAFEGKLVSQDPNDEPASVLLERIKAEKTKLKN